MRRDLYHGDGDEKQPFLLDEYIEKLLWENFQIDRDGIFLDVGAYHPSILSNSYYFEKEKNFQVICVEANPMMAELLRQERKHVFECAAWNQSGETLDFQIVKGPFDPYGFGGSQLWWGSEHPYSIERIQVKTRTLNEILEESQIDHLDVLSMDIEGAEKFALEGLDFEKYKPKVLCIERHLLTTDMPFYYDLEDFATRNGYKFMNRLHMDDFYIRDTR